MKKQRKVINGFILLKNTECNFDEIKNNLKNDWNIEVSEKDIKNDSMVFDIEKNTIAFSFIPAPVPNGEAEENASHNYLWADGVEKTSEHKAQIITAVMGEDPYKASELFNKIVSSGLKLPNAIGIYKYPTVISSEEYIEIADYLKENELPLANMIYIGLYNTDDGMCGYTEGLTFFDKKEIEVLNTSLEPFDLYNFIYDVAYYVLSNNIELKDGETIGFTAEQKLPITISKGVSLEGETIKIAYDVIEN